MSLPLSASAVEGKSLQPPPPPPPPTPSQTQCKLNVALTPTSYVVCVYVRVCACVRALYEYLLRHVVLQLLTHFHLRLFSTHVLLNGFFKICNVQSCEFHTWNNLARLSQCGKATKSPLTSAEMNASYEEVSVVMATTSYSSLAPHQYLLLSCVLLARFHLKRQIFLRTRIIHKCTRAHTHTRKNKPSDCMLK